MHKKLASDLISLAHSILQIKNKEDVRVLRDKAHVLYEKLSVLAFVEDYVDTTPGLDVDKEVLQQKVVMAIGNKESDVANVVVDEDVVAGVVSENEDLALDSLSVDSDKDEEVLVDSLDTMVVENSDVADKVSSEGLSEEVKEEKVVMKVVEEIIEQPFDELESLLFDDSDTKDDVKDVAEKKTVSLEDELQDTLSVDVMANLFEKAVPEKSTLNSFLQNTIQIGLNDRIAFVKHLFDGSQSDFNRVVSQLNTMKTEKEAKRFVTKVVKPDYDWSTKEEYEHRFLEIIERRFL